MMNEYLAGDYFRRFFNKIVKSNSGLDEKDILEIDNKMKENKLELHRLKVETLNLKALKYFDQLKKEGKSSDEIIKFFSEDKELLDRMFAFKEYQKDLRTKFFGYPANLNEDSAFVRFLRKKESELAVMNNCGDPYETGNYLMDSKEFEKDVLGLFYKKFGVDPQKGWGYVTTGGSESNAWAIKAGFRKYPNAKLYFSEATHYSVEKTASNGKETIFPYSIIPQEGKFSEKIDKQKLLDEIRKNWDNGKGNPAVMVLTWGTTKFGAFDDIQEITKELKKDNIPYYLHVDAACHGGIPNNQKNAPVTPTLHELNADSISVSFHKFFGIPTVNGVLITKDKADGQEISYIGQRDTTIAGSRTFPAVSTLKRLKEILERSPEDLYSKNIEIFETELEKSGVIYHKGKQSNMFVFPEPTESSQICKKYQLSTFEGTEGTKMAHAIIFPFHSLESMRNLVNEIKMDQKKYALTFDKVKSKENTTKNGMKEQLLLGKRVFSKVFKFI